VSSMMGGDFKEQVRAKTNIVDLINETRPVIPKRGGREYVALCPFHDDHSPSMTINPERQTYRCWVCNEGGDCFHYFMKLENVPFFDALKMLAEKAGLEMPTSSVPAAMAGKNKADIYAACQWARDQFHQYLLRSPAAQKARDYLLDRGIHEESWVKFHLGYHPDNWTWLIERAEGKFSIETLEDARLISKRANQPGYCDSYVFIGRVMFPIHDLSGRCVAYGGRVLPGNEGAKYMNSPESIIFSKSNLAFALDLARDGIKRKNTVLVMEGYTDTIMAHQYGLDHVVATLGTALADSHVSLLKRFCQQVVLVYDGDTAGQNAAERALGRFVAQDVDLRILSLPEKLDPADFLAQKGVEAFDQLASNAPDALAFKLEALIRKHGIGTEFARQNVLVEMLALLKSIPRSIPKPHEDRMLQRLAHRLGIREETIRAELRRQKSPGPTRQAFRESVVTSNENVDENAAIEQLRLEKKQQFDRIKTGKAGKDARLICEVLQIILAAPEAAKVFNAELRTDEIEEGLLRGLYAHCVSSDRLSQLEADSHQNQNSLLDLLSDDSLESYFLRPLAEWLLSEAELKQVATKVRDELGITPIEATGMTGTLIAQLRLRRSRREQLSGIPGQFNTSGSLDETSMEAFRKAADFHRQRADPKKSSA
jgi:DNA primase